MDNDTANLIAQLCTHAGMIMEDYSIVALSVRPAIEPNIAGKLIDLGLAIDRMAAMIEAAKALLAE